MASETKTVKAGCLCGAIKHEVTLLASDFPIEASTCMCDSCRHMTGTLGLGVSMLKGRLYNPEREVFIYYEPSEELLSKLTPFQFSKSVTQYFCPTCGCHCLARINMDGEIHYDVTNGTWEVAEGIHRHVGDMFVQDTIDGGFTHFLPSLDGKPVQSWPGDLDHGSPLPQLWRCNKASEATTSPSDRLNAHCKCKGINFWISRPSATASSSTAEAKGHPVGTFHQQHASLPKYPATNCACTSCRLSSGFEIVQWAFIPISALSLSPSSSSIQIPFSFTTGTLQSYQSSSRVTRYFCGVCGAMALYVHDETPEEVDVGVGLLDAPEGARAEDWLEWRTEVDYREDGIGRARALIEGLEEGLRGYAVRREGSGS